MLSFTMSSYMIDIYAGEWKQIEMAHAKLPWLFSYCLAVVSIASKINCFRIKRKDHWNWWFLNSIICICTHRQPSTHVLSRTSLSPSGASDGSNCWGHACSRFCLSAIHIWGQQDYCYSNAMYWTTIEHGLSVSCAQSKHTGKSTRRKCQRMYVP